jgi:hypothetical protein
MLSEVEIAMEVRLEPTARSALVTGWGHDGSIEPGKTMVVSAPIVDIVAEACGLSAYIMEQSSVSLTLVMRN